MHLHFGWEEIHTEVPWTLFSLFLRGGNVRWHAWLWTPASLNPRTNTLNFCDGLGKPLAPYSCLAPYSALFSLALGTSVTHIQEKSVHFRCHCFCLYRSDFILINTPSLLYRGLESCPCTSAPWGPASGQLWLPEPAVSLFLFQPVSAHTCQPHLPFVPVTMLSRDSSLPVWTCTYQMCVSICLDLVFRFLSGPHPVWTTFSQLILSPAINNSNNNIIYHVFIVHQHFQSFILTSCLGPVPSSWSSLVISRGNKRTPWSIGQ